MFSPMNQDGKMALVGFEQESRAFYSVTLPLCHLAIIGTVCPATRAPFRGIAADLLIFAKSPRALLWVKLWKLANHVTDF